MKPMTRLSPEQKALAQRALELKARAYFKRNRDALAKLLKAHRKLTRLK
jgi:hypothetical protein